MSKIVRRSFFWQRQGKVNVRQKEQVFFLKKNEKVYFKFHSEYMLPKKNNRKLSNQRCESFFMKRHVNKFVYKIKLPSRWKIHSVISIAQLKFANGVDPYDKKKPHYPDAIEMKKDIKFEKSYKMKKMMSKRIKIYDKISVIEYLIR